MSRRAPIFGTIRKRTATFFKERQRLCLQWYFKEKLKPVLTAGRGRGVAEANFFSKFHLKQRFFSKQKQRTYRVYFMRKILVWDIRWPREVLAWNSLICLALLIVFSINTLTLTYHEDVRCWRRVPVNHFFSKARWVMKKSV